MADTFYRIVVLLGRFPFWVSSCPLVLHADRVPRDGALILASNHTRLYDVPALTPHTPRRPDCVAYGEPIEVCDEEDEHEAERALAAAYQRLYAELHDAHDIRSSPLPVFRERAG